jgi:hypothetical protein
MKNASIKVSRFAIILDGETWTWVTRGLEHPLKLGEINN